MLSDSSLHSNIRSKYFQSLLVCDATSSSSESSTSTSTSTKTTHMDRFTISTKTYQHDGWTLSYKHKEITETSTDNDLNETATPPLLLIHPVGIGISNWFWDRLMEEWEGEVYAPNLIGCARDGLGDTWDPSKRGLFLPLDWVRGCEALIQQKMTLSSECVVVTQGGLAPLGVLLAHRDLTNQHSQSKIKGLVLTSPPTWEDMVNPVPQSELDLNYNFLSSPIGSLAFQLLENTKVIQFFSDLFLFQEKCDNEWLEQTSFELNNVPKSSLLRPPVMVFNAGILQSRSLLEELTEIQLPTKILCGEGDKRTMNRKGYTDQMKDSSIQSIEGCNVLPWENARGTCEAIRNFIQANDLMK